MRSIRLTTVLDGSGEVKIPVPAELRSGEKIQLEVFFHDEHEMSEESWSKLLDSVEGLFEAQPLEIPVDAHPEKIDFEG